MAFSIAAGSRVRDVYEAANKYNAVVVGASAEDVGIVGWLTGGGHGPLTSMYGMGADNVMQATVVTPAGEIVTANECQHADLLWAIRGGGGGTFGVVTEVVMKGYPALPMETLSFSITPRDADDADAFWDAVTFWHSQLPRLKEGGMSGYNAMYGPKYYSPGFEQGGDGSWILYGALSVFGQPNGTTASLYQPIQQYMSNVAGHVNYTQIIERNPVRLINIILSEPSWHNVISVPYEGPR
jgi:FAD/FMN-containing dehydrogenase